MAVYYVNPSVSNGSGTEVSPFNSFANVPSLNPGDSVLFRAGTTHVGQVLYDSSRGAASVLAAPITFGKYGPDADGLPVIRSSGWCIDVHARSGVVVQDLKSGPESSYSDGGVRILNSGECRVQRVTTESRCDYGVRVDSTISSALENIEVLDSSIEGTFNNTGILFVWGSSSGGVFRNVKCNGNAVRNTGLHSSVLTGSPMGIRFISRTQPATSIEGTVDLDLFSSGVECIGNALSDIDGYGINCANVSSGLGESIKNRIGRNTLANIGDGRFDAHMLWIGCSRDIVVDYNELDSSTMFQGSAFGTGIGIFVDNNGFANLYENSKRIVVRRNNVRNTGLRPEGSLNDSVEIQGAGILAFLSQNVDFIDNEVTDCYNGVGVIGWYGGSSGKTSNLMVRGNRVLRAKNYAYAYIKAAASVTHQENIADGYVTAGTYIENDGAFALTDYVEARNTMIGDQGNAYMGGSAPTTSTAISQRDPASGNLSL